MPSIATAGTDYVTPSGNITGNAATATKLAATVNINGVAFDGSAAITAPVVATGTGFPHMTAGVQDGASKAVDLSGGDATGTLAGARAPAFTGDVTNSAGSLATTVGKINGTSLAGLSTGILKNTTATGVPSIATAGTDYVIPSGSITGNAATATKLAATVNINGVAFDGSAAITAPLWRPVPASRT